MTTGDYSPDEPYFGYLPDAAEALESTLERGAFARALAVDVPVKAVFGGIESCRILWQPEVELPAGLYWFEGVEAGSLVVHVGGGEPPGGAVVTAMGDLAPDDSLMAAWAWAEQFWSAAEDVPPPRFTINDLVIKSPGDRDATVVDQKFLSAHWSYTVLVAGRREEVFETGLKPRPQLDDPRTWVTGEPTPASRFGATLTRAKLRGKFTDTLFSFRATRTTFRPYQFKPVLKLLQTGKARLLIADEVGLGKTIEAGLIWTELEARQEADQVLVVCPASLVTKWKEEMADRFDFELTELDGNGLNDFLHKHRQNRLPRRLAYVCSLQRLSRWDGLDELRDLPPAFDLVIVDEAHSMRNQDTKSYALGTELSEWADNLVFLTATPINLHQTDLLHLLELLAPEDYGDLSDLELRLEPNGVINAVAAKIARGEADGARLGAELAKLKETTLGRALMQRRDFALLTELLSKPHLEPRDLVSAKRMLAELNTLSTVITRTKKVDVDEGMAKRKEIRREIDWTQPEKDFYDEYVEWCRRRAAEMKAPSGFAMQMPLRLASACLPMARRSVLDPVGFGTITDEDSEEPSGRLEPHPELVDAALHLPEGLDSKFDSLHQVLDQLHRQCRRALVFTFSRPTLSYLADRLGRDFKVEVMHGGVSREERRRIMAEFRSGAYDFVLANRVASEGLDFEFCSAVVNYDLPWNPMEIEQRIGRIDRIGQQEEVILIANFVNEYTIDERILARLLDRIEIFESSIGALEPIIAAIAPMAREAAFDFKLNREQREQKLYEVLMAIEEKRAGLEDVADASAALLVSNDVDIAGLEDELIRTGRYVGQRELALLVDDWAQVERAPGMTFSDDSRVVELLGNRAMGVRIDELAVSQKRTRNETSHYSALLRNEMPISLVLDQELARTGGGMLLTATSPLTMAAVLVPGHREARFASLRVAAPTEIVVPGIYVVVLAKAASAGRGGDEIWGAAVAQNGRNAGEGPANALLAALAEGRLEDAALPDMEQLPKLADRALDQLDLRHSRVKVERDQEFDARQEDRRIRLGEQHRRKIETIQKRIDTAAIRGRGSRAIGLFYSQMRRAEEKFARLMTELANEPRPEIHLEYLAACVVQFVSAGDEA
jgi:superfamily II DNA or RNA helicase